MNYEKEKQISEKVRNDVGNSVGVEFRDISHEYIHYNIDELQHAEREMERKREENIIRESTNDATGVIPAFLKLLFTNEGHKSLVFIIGSVFWMLWTFINILLSDSMFSLPFVSLFLGGAIAINFVISYFIYKKDSSILLSFKLMMLLCCISCGSIISMSGLSFFDKELLSFVGVVILLVSMFIPFFITRGYFKAKSLKDLNGGSFFDF